MLLVKREDFLEISLTLELLSTHGGSRRWEAHIWVKAIGKQVYLGGYEQVGGSYMGQGHREAGLSVEEF